METLRFSGLIDLLQVQRFDMSPPANDSEQMERTGGVCVAACLSSGLPLPATVLDLARSDVRILSDRPLKQGTQVNLVLFLPRLSNTFPNKGTVHWCRPSDSGWELGLYLNTVLPATLMTRSWWELRSSIRYDCNWRAWLETNDGQSREVINILDYSLGGMRIGSTARLTKGQLFRFSHSSYLTDDAWIVGRVERIDIRPGEYGCFLPHESGRFLPSLFNQGSSLHVESPFVEGLNVSSSLLPEMIDKLPIEGFDTSDE